MAFEEFILDGRVAIVTGGGRGLGRAMALALATAGADVVVAARTVPEIEETCMKILKLGKRSIAIPTDVLSSESVQNMAQRTVSEFARIDILVNNSGIAIHKPLTDTTEEEWNKVIGTNLTGMFLCTRAIGPQMIKQRSGKIINMASNVGVIGRKNFVSYCVSKAGVIQFTRALAVEWARYNINVNAIGPGYFYTDINASVFDDDRVRDKLLRKVPLRRVGNPNELGPLVVYLASAASDFMTGETIFIDGGSLCSSSDANWH
jgi:NAD(P)-dependent dehydrogenase (short-subunit alcohol dehydrogenase family)